MGIKEPARFLAADITGPVDTTLECTITELMQTNKGLKSVFAL